MKEKICSVKRSVLAKWREQIIQDSLVNPYSDNMTEREKMYYSQGIVAGVREITSTLTLHDLLKIIND